MRCAANRCQNIGIGRCRISNTIPAIRIGRQNPKHRAADTFARRVLEIRAEPFDFSRAFEAVARHAELAEHQRLVHGGCGRHPILNELLQRLWRVNKAVVVITRIAVHIAVIDVRERVILQPFTTFRG